MKQTELETKSAGSYAYAAARDARMRNIVESSHYSEKQKIAADRMALALELVYHARAIHINYRKKFISVKVDRAYVKNRENLQYLEAEYETLGYKKSSSPQGVIYRIPKV
jgi:hypothetical protein